MENIRVFTCNGAATRAKLVADGRRVATYARSRGFTETSAAKILQGDYPFQEKLDSVYQRFLCQLHKDGYLVELPEEHKAA